MYKQACCATTSDTEGGSPFLKSFQLEAIEPLGESGRGVVVCVQGSVAQAPELEPWRIHRRMEVYNEYTINKCFTFII